MKKLLIFALLLIPVTSFAASSVRVLGSGSNNPSSTTKTSSKVVPTKATVAKPAAAKTASQSGDSNTSRLGTIRAKPKTTLGTVSSGSTTTTTSAGSRFPVITPANSYNTVTKPQAGNISSGSGVTPSGVLDDPRFDMIKKSKGSPEGEWRDKGTTYDEMVDDRLSEGYVFMWIEE